MIQALIVAVAILSFLSVPVAAVIACDPYDELECLDGCANQYNACMESPWSYEHCRQQEAACLRACVCSDFPW